jgi:hypothetical protein
LRQAAPTHQRLTILCSCQGRSERPYLRLVWIHTATYLCTSQENRREYWPGTTKQKSEKKNNDFRPKLVRTKKTEKFDLEVKKDRRHANFKVRSQGSFLEILHSLKENRHILSENHYVLIGNR